MLNALIEFSQDGLEEMMRSSTLKCFGAEAMRKFCNLLTRLWT